MTKIGWDGKMMNQEEGALVNNACEAYVLTPSNNFKKRYSPFVTFKRQTNAASKAPRQSNAFNA